MNTRYIPPARPVTSTSGFVRPSGALSVAQVANAQGILVWLGHLPRNVSSITGARDSLTAAAVLRFQQNYNEEQRNRNYRFQPRQLVVDGDLGTATVQALANYNAAAAAGGYGLGITESQLRTLGGAAAQGAGSGPAAITNTTTIETTPATPTPARPTAPRPTPTPAPQRQQPSEPFPTGPLLAVVAGAAVLAGAVWYRSGSSKRKGG
jgi:hypothetical protein